MRRAPLFAGLDQESAESLIAQMTTTHMERGDILFHAGDPGDRLYVLGEGKIKLGQSSPDGRENILAVLGPGERRESFDRIVPRPKGRA